MNVIVVDDESIILKMETSMIKEILPGACVEMFSDGELCLDFAKDNPVDIAFLDINMEDESGIELAKKLQDYNPRVNIIFCTGYSEYSLEALSLYCSAYLMKPITEEKLTEALRQLRFPVSEKVSGLYLRCFGNFEASFNGEPIKFKYGKTKMFLAYLIDRVGAVLSVKEIMVAIEEDGRESYVRNLKADLINTFRLLGIQRALILEGGKIGIRKEAVDCDYYSYLNGDKKLFRGEYMSQYSFGEMTLARL